MTVEELIRALHEFPADAEVVAYFSEFSEYVVETVARLESRDGKIWLIEEGR